MGRCIIPYVSFNEEALVIKFTTLLGKSDKGNLAYCAPTRRAPHIGLTLQPNQTEVLFWFQMRKAR